VSGAINWLTYDASSSSRHAIVSIDLDKESYQNICRPYFEIDFKTLRVLKHCLCIYASGDIFMDVSIMKEY